MYQYSVYGYYSSADVGRHPDYLDTFATREEADQCVQDFESVQGRSAWVEEEPIACRQ
jgi:hypothetical protein